MEEKRIEGKGQDKRREEDRGKKRRQRAATNKNGVTERGKTRQMDVRREGQEDKKKKTGGKLDQTI